MSNSTSVKSWKSNKCERIAFIIIKRSTCGRFSHKGSHVRINGITLLLYVTITELKRDGKLRSRAS